MNPKTKKKQIYRKKGPRYIFCDDNNTHFQGLQTGIYTIQPIFDIYTRIRRFPTINSYMYPYTGDIYGKKDTPAMVDCCLHHDDLLWIQKHSNDCEMIFFDWDLTLSCIQDPPTDHENLQGLWDDGYIGKSRKELDIYILAKILFHGYENDNSYNGRNRYQSIIHTLKLLNKKQVKIYIITASWLPFRKLLPELFNKLDIKIEGIYHAGCERMILGKLEPCGNPQCNHQSKQSMIHKIINNK
jgi:hypothetical protein